MLASKISITSMKRKIVNSDDSWSKKQKENATTDILPAAERERRKTSLYRAPTSEELNELRENENLYKNNLFRMQIQYLLEEVCLEEKKSKKVNDILHQLNEFLCNLKPSDQEFNLSEGTCIPSGINFPLPTENISISKIKGKFKFLPPKEVKVVGSYILKTFTKPNNCINVAVEIPKECLQPRDCINYRYHFKRATYLCWLVKFLQKWEHTEKLSFTTESDRYKPNLLLKLKGKAGKRFLVKLHLSIPDDVFKLHRFSPLMNNVRSHWFDDVEEGLVEELDFPTPHYNSSILSDILYETHLHELYAVLKECPAMKEALCLCKVWLKQRSFKADSPFNGFIMSMFMTYLFQTRKISSHMSSYQMFRQVLNSLASSDWSKDGITMCKDESCDVTLSDFHGRFDVVFIDPSGFLNLCANVDLITYDMMKHEASLSLACIDNPAINGFDALFIHCKDFLQSVDHSVRLSSLDDFKLKVSHSDDYKPGLIDHGGDWTHLLPKQLHIILSQGLEKRIHRLVLKPSSNCEWDVTSSPPSFDRTFMVGLHLDTEGSENVLIMGPPADQPEVLKYDVL